MATKCIIPILGKRIRVTELDSCGNPPPPLEPEAFVATDGFISLTLSADVEEGTEILTRKANGALCVNERQASSFKRFSIEIEFCGVNPSLLGLVTNAEGYQDYAGDVAGITVAEGTIEKYFALELWTGLSGQACEPGAEEASGYMVLPFVNGGVLGDITIDGENAVTFSLTGAYTRGGNAWGVGPFEVLLDGSANPAALPSPLDPLDHLLLIDTSLAPPPEACDLQAMPEAPTPPALTGVQAGTPGTFVPLAALPPTDLAALKADVNVGDSAYSGAAWTTGQYVELGDDSLAHWDGSAWAAGAAS